MRTLLLVLLAAAFAPSALANDSPCVDGSRGRPTPSEHLGEEVHTLSKIDASWNELRVEADVDALERLLLDDWILTHSDGRVQTKAEYLGELKTRSRTNQSILNVDVEVRRNGPLAVVTGTSIQSGMSDGKPWSGHFRFTRVWIMQGDRWRMAASHSSRISASVECALKLTHLGP